MSRWTPEQAAAISHRGSDLLVSAAAGSGKTAVLVERIRSLLLDGPDKTDIDRLLVVTFTRAAAAEMRQRIQQSLLQALADANADHEHIRRQLDLLPDASISTIHSFCTRILRRHCYMAGLAPDFRVADATEMELLKAELMGEVLEEAYGGGGESIDELAELFGDRIDDRRLQTRLLQLYDFMQSKVDGCLWLRDSIDALKNEAAPEDNVWVQRIPPILAARLPAIRATLEAALQIARDSAIDPYALSLEDDINLLADVMRDLALLPAPEVPETLRAVKFARLKPAPRDGDKAAQERVKALRGEAKKQLEKLQAGFAFKPLPDMLEDMAAMVPALEQIQRILERFADRFRAEKRARNQADYNDLEQLSIAVLRHPEVAEEYRRSFEHVMVDEYQDSNEVQEAILQAVSRGGNRFMVGDVKQSIYRFRLAAPEIFLQRYEEYAQDAAAGTRIDLSKNFRSNGGIIDGVNHIFSRLMRRATAEIEYDHKAALIAGLPPQDTDAAAIRVHLIDRAEVAPEPRAADSGEEEAAEALEHELHELKDLELEALLIRRRIAELIGQPFYDHQLGVKRGLQYRDIVILMRNTRERASLVAEILQQGGVPVYADSNTSYFDTPEVSIMLDLLSLLDNGEQDLPLLSVLNSPLFDFDLSELYAVRRALPQGSFRAALEACAAGEESDLAAKAQDFLTRWEHWRVLSVFLPVDDLIWTMLHQTGYYHYVLALPGGEQRQANLRLLLDQARQFGQSSLSGLFQFLQFMERVKSASGDQASARLLGENSDLVRIMSIHKSKGLEFPLVFVCGLGQPFNLSDLKRDMMLHRKLGLGLRCVDVRQRVWSESLARSVLREQLRAEQLAEELRILYVAFTRARWQLILLGTVKKLAVKQESFRLSSGSGYMSAQSYLDWLGPIWQEAGDAAPFAVSVFDAGQLSAAAVPAEDSISLLRARLDEPPLADSEVSAEVRRRLNWEYPYAQAGSVLSKQTVSRLSHPPEEETILSSMLMPRPRFMEDAALTAAERGTLYHLVLQHLPPEAQTAEEIKEFLDAMERSELITSQERALIGFKPLQDFAASSLAARLRRAERVHRELPFNYLVSEDSPLLGRYEVYPEMLVQGVIDLCFVEDGAWVLVDYKSDRTDDDTIRRRYARQLDLYRIILEQLTGLPVKEALFWGIANGRAIASA
ncbi:MAG: helicase-exonuclease AddAB subunit AddA [Syntrophomonadaceae bacterium]|nr:helicase-exonuclease AddAB subunit AddA [Syntrophomonadaceae bacterium]